MQSFMDFLHKEEEEKSYFKILRCECSSWCQKQNDEIAINMDNFSQFIPAIIVTSLLEILFSVEQTSWEHFWQSLKRKMC